MIGLGFYKYPYFFLFILVYNCQNQMFVNLEFQVIHSPCNCLVKAACNILTNLSNIKTVNTEYDISLYIVNSFAMAATLAIAFLFIGSVFSIIDMMFKKTLNMTISSWASFKIRELRTPSFHLCAAQCLKERDTEIPAILIKRIEFAN